MASHATKEDPVMLKGQIIFPSSMEFLEHEGNNNMILEDGESSDVVGRCSSGLLPQLISHLGNSSSSTCTFAASSSPPEAHSGVNLKAVSDHPAYSHLPVLSFDPWDPLPHGSYLAYLDHEHKEAQAIWYDSMEENCPINPLDAKRGTSSSQLEDQSVTPYPTPTEVDGLHASITRLKSIRKRPYSSDDEKQYRDIRCGTIRKAKDEPRPSKNTKSLAAKNRRERINERFRILHGLVPSVTKVDLVTMLENAISYVKFLQLQVTVLATSEFWPAQEGKAQATEAVDAILSSKYGPNQPTLENMGRKY